MKKFLKMAGWVLLIVITVFISVKMAESERHLWGSAIYDDPNVFEFEKEEE